METEDKKINKWKWWMIIAAVVFVLMNAIPVGIVIINFNASVTVEAGQPFSEADIWKEGFSVPVEMEPVNTSGVGSGVYRVLALGMIPLELKVEVVDTTEPVLLTEPVEIIYGQECSITDFIRRCEDISGVNFRYVVAPDYTKVGTQHIEIEAKDSFGNYVVMRESLFIKGYTNTYVMELGDEIPDASVFALSQQVECTYVTDVSQLVILAESEHKLMVLADGEEIEVTLIVKDTKAPVVQVEDRECYLNKTIAPESFVTSVTDFSETVITFVTEPDYSVEGVQKVLLSITDAAGNETQAEANLNVVLDKEAPVITTTNIKVGVNETISYKKNIDITDNCDDPSQIRLTVDNSAVNISEEGIYIVRCTAVDSSGNQTIKDIIVTVGNVATSTHTQEEINAYADNILAQIIDDSMTLYEKAYEIYKYTRSTIAYVNNSPKGDWLQGAYDGMVKKQGDCFAFAAMGKALLERIGVNPLVITKEKESWTSQSNHYWLLVDLGEGYYHFDPTRRVDGVWFFMWTDEKMLEYSNNHQGSHNFTRSKYPEIQ